EGSDEVLGERGAVFGDEQRAGTFGDEHSDAASLLQNTFGHELVDSLGSCGRIDGIEAGEFVRRRGLGELGKRSVEDRVLDLLGYLSEKGFGTVDHFRLHVHWLVT